MSLTPDFLNLTKESTFSSVAKGTASLPIQLDNSYPSGGYPVTSEILFNAAGYTFHLLNGLAANAGLTKFYLLLHDVPNSKLILLDPATGAEVPNATNLSLFTAYCTFHRW